MGFATTQRIIAVLPAARLDASATRWLQDVLWRIQADRDGLGMLEIWKAGDLLAVGDWQEGGAICAVRSF